MKPFCETSLINGKLRTELTAGVWGYVSCGRWSGHYPRLAASFHAGHSRRSARQAIVGPAAWKGLCQCQFWLGGGPGFSSDAWKRPSATGKVWRKPESRCSDTVIKTGLTSRMLQHTALRYIWRAKESKCRLREWRGSPSPRTPAQGQGSWKSFWVRHVDSKCLTNRLIWSMMWHTKYSIRWNVCRPLPAQSHARPVPAGMPPLKVVLGSDLEVRQSLRTKGFRAARISQLMAECSQYPPRSAAQVELQTAQDQKKAISLPRKNYLNSTNDVPSTIYIYIYILILS